VEEIMNKVAPSDYPEDNIYWGVHNHRMPSLVNKVCLKEDIDRRNFVCSVVETPVRKLPGKLRGRPCITGDTNVELQTFVQRNATPGAEFTAAEEEYLARSCIATFERIFTNIHQVDLDDIVMATAEQCDKIHDKGDGVQAKVFDPDVYADSDCIRCFMKAQTKQDLNENSYLRWSESKGEFKAGQGISAQDKSINLLFGPLVRAVEAKFIASLPAAYQNCFGISNEDLKVIVTKALGGKAELPEFLQTDISQFDTVHGNWSKVVMEHVFNRFGIHDALIKIADKYNTNWVLSHDIVNIWVHERLQSGRADTLFKNSTVALLLVMANTTYDELDLVMFQGDDVTIAGKNIVLSTPPFLAPYVKAFTSNVGSVVGYTIGKTLYPDVCAMVAKLTNRNFWCPTRHMELIGLEQYSRSVYDRLRLVKEEEYFDFIQVNAALYQLSDHEVEYLYAHLCRFATNTPEENLKCTMRSDAYSIVRECL